MNKMQVLGQRAGGLIVAIIYVIFALPAIAQTLVGISDSAALSKALHRAVPGTVLELESGTYGTLVIRDLQGTPENHIVVRPVKGADVEVSFSRLNIRDSAYITLDGLIFDYTFVAGDKLNFRPFQVNNSRAIHITNNLFDGDVAKDVSPAANGFGAAFGLAVRGSAEILIELNEIRGFFRGFLAAQSADLVVRKNDIHSIRMDGMNFAQVQKVRIEGNHLHNFKRSLNSKDHADMIQFWTNGTDVPSSDIIIRDNVLNSGKGYYTQSIFMRNDMVDRGLAGKEMYYRNITIENNVILNAHLHGITVGETDGLIIRNNTVLHNRASDGLKDSPGLWTPQIRLSPASENVQVTQNITSVIAGYEGQLSWLVSGNLLVQDLNPKLPDFYDTHFLAARTGDSESLLSFSYLPGSVINQKKLGASHLSMPTTTEILAPVAQVIEDARYNNRFIFDASATLFPPTQQASKAEFVWLFESGQHITGSKITHTFDKPGKYSVILRVSVGGIQKETTVSLLVPNVDVLTFNASDGVFRTWNGNTPQRAKGTPAVIGKATLGNGRARIDINRTDIRNFFGARDFDLEFRIRATDGYKSAGELMRIHKTLVLKITGRGSLELEFNTLTASPLQLRTPPLRLTDGNWHDLRVAYSASKGQVDISVNGQVVSTGKTTGEIRPLESWGLALGNPFGNRKSFDGELKRLWLRANVEAFVTR
ncbi:right-handed parallel beta-helix repeat-containing protein [Profundibacter sp.]